MCRLWSRLILVGLILSITFLYPLLAPPAHRIDKAHFEMIQPGMTRAEVEAIFGVPPGEYNWAEAKEMVVIGKSFVLALGVDSDTVQELEYTQCNWISPQGSFSISFDEQGRVDHKIGPLQIDIVPPWQRWWRAWKK